MNSKRCVSKCKKLSQTECKTKKKCKYAVGTQRSFCRLNPSYKMDINDDCKPKLKNTKKNRNDAAKYIQRKYKSYKNKSTKNISLSDFESKTKTKEISKIKSLTIPSRLKENKKRIIANFMYNTRHKQRALYLSTICSKSGFCMTFGREEKKISDFFDNFVNFKYAISPVKSIGESSANGFIKEIIYERENYKCNAVLKSNQIRGNIKDGNQDSLWYEWFVGQFINTLTSKFPNFVKTYGLFKYNNIESLTTCMKNKDMKIDIFKSLLKVVPTKNIYKNLCNRESKLFAVLFEYVENPITINSLLKKLSIEDSEILRNEIIYILYQIYFVIDNLSGKFIHCDFHYNNVLLYQLPETQYITIHYYSKKVVTLYSRYIPKIIDYGKSYFYWDEKRNSTYLWEEILCKINECKKPKCGRSFGFPNYTQDFVNMDKAMGFDLKYIRSLILNDTSLMEDLFGIKNLFGQLNNINKLKNILENKILTIPKDIYSENGYTSVGDLHIYGDKDMEFIPSK